jgi:hypothetical protein
MALHAERLAPVNSGLGVPRGTFLSPSPGSENPDGSAEVCLRWRCMRSVSLP